METAVSWGWIGVADASAWAGALWLSLPAQQRHLHYIQCGRTLTCWAAYGHNRPTRTTQQWQEAFGHLVQSSPPSCRSGKVATGHSSASATKMFWPALLTRPHRPEGMEAQEKLQVSPTAPAILAPHICCAPVRVQAY